MSIDSFFLNSSIHRLKKADIATARLDCEVMAADLLNKDRSWLHAHPEFELTDEQVATLDIQVARRAKHEPLAYIRGKQEFYGREFYVTRDTLTPRPETETMIEMLKEFLSRESAVTGHDEIQIIDVGTGSGCIIITAALELSNSRYHPSADGSNISYTGLDISKKALEVAEKNAKNLGANVAFAPFDLLKDDLSSNIKYQISNIFLANLPYVPTYYPINQAATHEPSIALFGGEDGLDYYRVLFRQLSQNDIKSKSHKQSTLVYTESLPSQHDKLSEIAKKNGFRLIANRDFVQVFKRN